MVVYSLQLPGLAIKTNLVMINVHVEIDVNSA